MLSLQELCIVSIEKRLMPIEIVLFRCISYMRNRKTRKPKRLASTLIVLWYSAFGITKTVNRADEELEVFISSGFFNGVQLYFIGNAVEGSSGMDLVLADVIQLRRCIRRQLVMSDTFPVGISGLVLDTKVTSEVFHKVELDSSWYGRSVIFSYVYWYERLTAEGGFKIETMFRAIKRQSDRKTKRRRTGYHKKK